MSYDERQAGAELLTCARCQCQRYVTHPRPEWLCQACVQRVSDLAQIDREAREQFETPSLGDF